jgi:hypothetical protein
MSTNNTCANCGKGEEYSGDLKSCTACKMVKYCNRECQIAHRPQHKKECKKRAAELFDAALFEEHSPEECPICMLPLPLNISESSFESCCGKKICNGCIHAMRETGGENMKLCPFCKTPPAESYEENIEMLEKLMEKGNADAFYLLAVYYSDGTYGLPQDRARANELYLKAGELGCAAAYYNLGHSYDIGRGGVEIDKKKAKHYYELAAMNGSVKARNNLGALEGETGNYHRAFKHFIIAASSGNNPSLDNVKDGYMHGDVTKEEYANTLREYQKSQDEVKSKARDKALAYHREIYLE